MSAQDVTRAVQAALAEERVATANRLWKRIEKVTGAPDNLRSPVGVSWLQLLRIFDEERKP